MALGSRRAETSGTVSGSAGLPSAVGLLSPLFGPPSAGAASASRHGAASGGGSGVQIRGLCSQRRAGTAHHEGPGREKTCSSSARRRFSRFILLLLRQAVSRPTACSGAKSCCCIDPWCVCVCVCAQDYSWEDHGFSLVNRLLPDMGQFLDEKFQVHTRVDQYHLTQTSGGTLQNCL